MDNIRKYDVVIIGGGASGLAAAVELRMSSPELSVLVIEKMPEPGRKLRATGSGRCNITNAEAEGFDRIMHFFSLIGLVTRRYSNGLVYPYSESAADVVNLLVERAEQLGCEFACSEEVISLEKGTSSEKRFEIVSAFKEKGKERRVKTQADYVILATGGKAGPNYGTTGDGYALARNMGHSIVTAVPALTGIECTEWDEYAEPDAHILAGTRTAGVVSLYKNEYDKLPQYDGPVFNGEYSNIEPLFLEEGEIQFTKYGLSGICIFNMTRHMRFDRKKGEELGDYYIKLNLFPDVNIGDYLFVIHQGAFADTPLKSTFCSILKAPLAEYVTEMINYTSDCMGLSFGKGRRFCDRSVSELELSDIRLICEVVHGLEFYPEKLRGWKDAQVTLGGVSMAEIDEKTSESKISEGLYICGELADRDFPCGGFNLSNAWLTGLAAADDIVRK